MSRIEILPLEGLPEVRPGDDVAALLAAAAADELRDEDVVVIAQKIVSKAEGRLVPAGDRRAAAAAESARILRRSGEMIISETRHGFVCANAGVDASNVVGDFVLLLPLDPDLSARRIRTKLMRAVGKNLGIVISDTFGRPWRVGQTNVAIGVAGFDPFHDYRGVEDEQGRTLAATRICIADEIAGAAELVMGKTGRIPAAIVRGIATGRGEGNARAIVRPPEEDLFR